MFVLLRLQLLAQGQAGRLYLGNSVACAHSSCSARMTQTSTHPFPLTKALSDGTDTQLNFSSRCVWPSRGRVRFSWERVSVNRLMCLELDLESDPNSSLLCGLDQQVCCLRLFPHLWNGAEVASFRSLLWGWRIHGQPLLCFP